MTKITIQGLDNKKCFEDLVIGTLFVLNGKLLVKDQHLSRGFNSISIQEGTREYVDEDSLVTLIDEIICKINQGN